MTPPDTEATPDPPAMQGLRVIETALATLPLSPGVYRMLDAKGDALYVGKARALKRRVAAYTLKVPVIRALFYRVADPERLETLGLVEVLGWTGDTLNRVDRTLFFRRFNEGEAVQYFY